MDKIWTHYDNLQISEAASEDVIKGAYRYLSQKWHPDKNPDRRGEAERFMKLINEAYAVLSNASRKHEYDEWLQTERVRSAAEEAPVDAMQSRGDEELKNHYTRTIANAQRLPGFLIGFVSTYIFLGLLLQIDRVKNFADAHPWTGLLLIGLPLLYGITGAQERVKKHQARLELQSVEMLDALYRERLQKKTVRQILAGVSILLVGAGVVGWFAFTKEHERLASDSTGQAVQRTPARASATATDQTPASARTIALDGVITVRNECDEDVRFMLMYRDSKGKWQTNRWEQDSGATRNLSDAEGLVRIGGDVYLYGETSNATFKWQGSSFNKSDIQRTLRGVDYVFRLISIPRAEDGSFVLRLICTGTGT